MWKIVSGAALVVWEIIVSADLLHSLVGKLRAQGSGGTLVANIILSPYVRLALVCVAIALILRGISEIRKSRQLALNSKHDEIGKKEWYETPEYDLTSRKEPAVEAPEEPAAEETKPEPERIVTNVTPEYLATFFKEHLAFQAKTLVAPFIGKWMKVSGFVDDVHDYALYSMVRLAPIPRQSASKSKAAKLRNVIDHISSIQVRASSDQKKWRDRFAVLRRDEKITVFGEIAEVSGDSVTLVSCEIVEPDES